MTPAAARMRRIWNPGRLRKTRREAATLLRVAIATPGMETSTHDFHLRGCAVLHSRLVAAAALMHFKALEHLVRKA
jgi:hypothetical protein